MKKAGRNLERFPQDFARVRKIELNPTTPYLFAKIISSTVVDGPTFFYEYEIKAAILDATTDSVDVKPDAITYTAYSISELGNQYGNYSFGVTAGEIPAGFDPKAIPDDTPVFCVAQKKSDGTFYYLIINTQAISGAC